MYVLRTIEPNFCYGICRHASTSQPDCGIYTCFMV